MPQTFDFKPIVLACIVSLVGTACGGAEALDLAGDSWERLPDMPVPRWEESW